MTFSEQDALRIAKECFTDSCFSWDKKELHIPCDYAELTKALNLAAAEALDTMACGSNDDVDLWCQDVARKYRAAATEAK